MSPSRSAYQRRGTGATHTSVVGIYPWIGYRVNERTTVWGVSGYGRGRLRLTPERGAALTSPMTMRMHAAGAQGQLTGNDSIVGLTLKTDVLQAVTSIDGVETPEGRLAASRADVSRIRSAIEGSRTWTMGRWVNLRPSVEVGIRRDAGDAEQGAGIDVGTGLLLTEHRSGLQIDVRMRRLLMHQAEGFEEQGTSISISYNPRPESPLGWIAEVEPGWGSETQGGADRLWSRDKMGGIATGINPVRRSAKNPINTVFIGFSTVQTCAEMGRNTPPGAVSAGSTAGSTAEGGDADEGERQRVDTLRPWPPPRTSRTARCGRETTSTSCGG